MKGFFIENNSLIKNYLIETEKDLSNNYLDSLFISLACITILSVFL